MSTARRRKAAHVVIVTPEAWGVTGENGGISTSVVHFARLFRTQGDRVTLLVGIANEREPAEDWTTRYARDGIELVIAVAAPRRLPERGSGSHGLEFPFRRISEAVADAIPADADIVYFQDWSALGFEWLRRRPSGSTGGPPAVTILRSRSKWLREYARRPEDGSSAANGRLDFAERFVIERSDYVVAPSRAYLDSLDTDGIQLPAGGRTRLLGHPWFPDGTAPAEAPRAGAFRRLVFFGRLETLKGFDVLVDALRLLHERRPELLAALDEVVFLGREGNHGQLSLQSVFSDIGSYGPHPELVSDLDSWQAHRYLAEVAAGSLVVIPSLRESFCYAAVEASLVPGLNLICSDAGGIPDVLGVDPEQLFSPTAELLCDALERWLERGPRPATELASYDWETANARWIGFHAEVLDSSFVSQPSRPRHRSSAAGLSVVVSTYEAPEALDAVLRAYSEQSDADFEVVVAEDGSSTATETVVSRWQTVLGGRLVHVTQPDEGFRLAAVRNLGARAALGSYLVFVDGDCVPRRNFVAAIRRAALPRWFLAGKRVDLSPELSRAVTHEGLAIGRWSAATALLRARRELEPWIHLTPRDRRRPWREGLPDFVPHGNAYGFLTAVGRSDFELVDGFDTRFVGWGDQDVDLAVRLQRLGLRCGYAGPDSTMFHLWHPSNADPDRQTWWLLQETKESDRIAAVEGLSAAGADFEDQVSAYRVGASSSSSEPANR